MGFDAPGRWRAMATDVVVVNVLVTFLEVEAKADAAMQRCHNAGDAIIVVVEIGRAHV